MDYDINKKKAVLKFAGIVIFEEYHEAYQRLTCFFLVYILIHLHFFII